MISGLCGISLSENALDRSSDCNYLHKSKVHDCINAADKHIKRPHFKLIMAWHRGQVTCLCIQRLCNGRCFDLIRQMQKNLHAPHTSSHPINRPLDLNRCKQYFSLEFVFEEKNKNNNNNEIPGF